MGSFLSSIVSGGVKEEELNQRTSLRERGRPPAELGGKLLQSWVEKDGA